MSFVLWELETLALGAGFEALSCQEGRGYWGFAFCQWVEGILFRLCRKSHLAPCMALGLQRRRAVLAETPPSSRVRTGRAFDSGQIRSLKENATR